MSLIKFLKRSALANKKTILIFISLLFFLADLLPKAKNVKYANTYSHIVKCKPKTNKPYIWVKKECPKFKEIILSWNAKKPKTGSLVFSISCLVKGEWTGWKRLATWGENLHLTYSRTKSPRLHTKHVRAEIPGTFTATGFRVCVKSLDGAKIKNLDALFCCTSQEKDFHPEQSTKFDFPSIKIDNLQTQSQMVLKHRKAPAMCMATSLSIAIQQLNGFKTAEKTNKNLATEITTFADAAYDQSLNIYGSWGLNIAEGYQHIKNGYLRAERLNNFSDIYKLLTKKIPVVVSIRGPLKNAALPHLNGHFIIVAGWSKKHQRVLCIDPAFKTNRHTKTSYAIEDFLKAWERSRRFSCIALKAG